MPVSAGADADMIDPIEARSRSPVQSTSGRDSSLTPRDNSRNRRRSRNQNKNQVGNTDPKNYSQRKEDSISIDRWNEQLAEMSLENSERINHRNSPAAHSPSELTDGGHSVTKMQAMMFRGNENMID